MYHQHSREEKIFSYTDDSAFLTDDGKIHLLKCLHLASSPLSFSLYATTYDIVFLSQPHSSCPDFDIFPLTKSNSPTDYSHTSSSLAPDVVHRNTFYKTIERVSCNAEEYEIRLFDLPHTTG